MLKKLDSVKKELPRLPLIALVLVNMIPVVGVLYFEWDAFVIVALYWAESIIIALHVVLRTIFAPARRVRLKYKLIGIPIFLWFFGWFISGLGTAIIFFFIIFPIAFLHEQSWTLPLLEDDFFQVSWPGPLGLFQLGIDSGKLMYYMMPQRAILVLFCLMISHGLSFIIDYILGGGRNYVDIRMLMGVPISRVLILHLSLMVGGFLIIIFKPHVTVLVCLVILKCLIDAKLYLSQQRKAKTIVSGPSILNR